MIKRCVLLALLLMMLPGSAMVQAQEATIHHGFLFFASEKYTVDEETFGIYDDGHLFTDLIKENQAAMDAFGSYRGWHITANVFTGLSFAAIVLGGVVYIPGVDKEVPEVTGVVCFATGGGLLVLGMIFEFIAWGNISEAAEIYNRDLIDEGPALKFDPIPTPTLALSDDGGHFALTWRF